VTHRRGRRLNQLLDNIKEQIGHWKLKEEALDHTVWGTRVGSGFEPVKNYGMIMQIYGLFSSSETESCP
jgi:hypothetical protein